MADAEVEPGEIKEGDNISKPRTPLSRPSAVSYDLIFGVLTPLSAIFQLYHGDQF